MWNIVDHYLELARRHRRLIVWTVAVTVFGTAAISIVQLITRPVYVASSSILMMPSDAEVAFAGGRLESVKTAQMLTDVQIEYLKSRSVAVAAVKTLEEAGVGNMVRKTEEQKSGLSSLLTASLSGTKRLFFEVYTILNSGQYVEPDPELQKVRYLRQAVTVQKIPGSYIVRVEVRFNSPAAAARAADVLAKAYVERMSSERLSAAAQLEEFLSARIAERETALAALTAKQYQLTRDLGLTPGDDDAANARAVEQKKYSDTEVQIRVLEQRLAELKAGRSKTTRQTVLATLDSEISLGEAEVRALKAGQLERARTLKKLEAAWQAQVSTEEPLTDVMADAEALTRDLQVLRNRLLDVSVSESTTLDRIRVIDPAVEPDYPETPRVLDNAILGLVAGLVLCMIMLVGIDTYSTRVATAADLERYAEGHSMGTLDPGHIRVATGRRTPKPKQLARLRDLGLKLERRLAMQGAFDAPGIQVTGMMSDEELTIATVTLARALAEAGREVVCRLSEDGIAEFAHAGTSRLSFTSAPDVASGRAVLLNALPSVLRGFSAQEAAVSSPALICAVAASQVGPDQIEDFREHATAAGITALTFVLVGS